MIKKFENHYPAIDPNAFIADSATIIGDVRIGAFSSVWYGSVIRGDIHYIKIGACTNIQDGTIIHVTSGKYPVEIGDYVTVGHRVIIHGCRIEKACLIGMGAVVLDGTIVEQGAIIAAGSVVKEGFRIPEHTFVAGVPARVKRDVSDIEYQAIIKSAENYAGLIKRYRECHE